MFLGAVLSVIGDKLVDAYLHMRSAKDLWEALESKFGAADCRERDVYYRAVPRLQDG